MGLESLGLFAATLAASAALTGVARRVSLRDGALDMPNERSSHVQPTPRGGGIAIVLASLAAMAMLTFLGRMDSRLLVALAGGGIAVALVGHLDDRGRIGIVGRLASHIAAAVWATAWVGGLTELQFGGEVVRLGHSGTVLTVLGIVWALNLFNFMDGIDGIAAAQAVFMATAGGALAILAGPGTSTPAACLAIAAASLGFLYWNWPPARIFMGDVGSGYLGFVLAVLALDSARERAVMLPVWLILGSVFFIDATVTLARRLLRRERFYQAHRSHAYQWQARRWNSHLRVTLACMLLNLAWLAPWAWASVRYPEHAVWHLVAAWGPLLILALVCGAGRRERSPVGSGASG